MKKILLSMAAATILAAPSLKAQYSDDSFEPYHNVEVGIGVVSIPQFAMTLGAVFGTAFSFGLFKVDNLNCTGAISTEYYYNINPHVAVGGIGVFENFSGDEFHKNTSTDEYEYSGKYSSLFTSVMPAAKFAWFSHDHFQMYSKVAVGGMVYAIPSEDDPGVQFSYAFQASPVCMAAGGGHCWGKLELGCGMTGLVQAGFVYRF